MTLQNFIKKMCFADFQFKSDAKKNIPKMHSQTKIAKRSSKSKFDVDLTCFLIQKCVGMCRKINYS